MKIILLHAFVFGLSAFLAAANPLENKPIRIGPGQKVELRISGVPKSEMKNWNGPYRVDANGFIKLPYLGKIQLDGTTPDQAGAKIRDLLKDRRIFTQPDIEITIPPSGKPDGRGGVEKPKN